MNQNAPNAMCYEAVKYMLDRIQDNPDVRWYCGPGTQMFYLLVQAEAAYLNHSFSDVEAARKRDLQPAYRRREAEVNTLRDQRDDARRACEQHGVNWAVQA